MRPQLRRAIVLAVLALAIPLVQAEVKSEGAASVPKSLDSILAFEKDITTNSKPLSLTK